jgi:hypothetical protein
MATDETRDRAREVIWEAVNRGDVCRQSAVDAITTDILTDLDLAGIRFAGEGEVVVDAGRFERVMAAGEMLREIVNAPVGAMLNAALDRAPVIADALQPGDLDPIGDSDDR